MPLFVSDVSPEPLLLASVVVVALVSVVVGTLEVVVDGLVVELLIEGPPLVKLVELVEEVVVVDVLSLFGAELVGRKVPCSVTPLRPVSLPCVVPREGRSLDAVSLPVARVLDPEVSWYSISGAPLQALRTKLRFDKQSTAKRDGGRRDEGIRVIGRGFSPRVRGGKR